MSRPDGAPALRGLACSICLNSFSCVAPACKQLRPACFGLHLSGIARCRSIHFAIRASSFCCGRFPVLVRTEALRGSLQRLHRCRGCLSPQLFRRAETHSFFVSLLADPSRASSFNSSRTASSRPRMYAHRTTWASAASIRHRACGSSARKRANSARASSRVMPHPTHRHFPPTRSLPTGCALRPSRLCHIAALPPASSLSSRKPAARKLAPPSSGRV